GVPDTWFEDDGNGGNALMIDLGTLGGSGSVAFDINDLGQVVGRSWRADGTGYHAFIIVPEDVDGDGVPDTWFRDETGPDEEPDGANDLMISLGTMGNAGGSDSTATGISNSGYVVGVLGGPNPVGGGAFIIVPEVDDNEVPDTWFSPDAQGGNALMIIVTTGAISQANGVNDSG
ncbi:unnamed protein product, partial [marine sediment metagenome]